jgi:hypothetical protein
MNKTDALVYIVMAGASVWVATVCLLQLLVPIRLSLQMSKLQMLLVGKSPQPKAFAAMTKDQKRELVERALQLSITAINRVMTAASEHGLTAEVTPMMKSRLHGAKVEYTLTGAVLNEGDCVCPGCTMKRMAQRSGIDASEMMSFDAAGFEGHRSVH